MYKQKTTLSEFLDEWLATVIKVSVDFSTFTSYNGYINNHIKRFLGETTLVNLKPAKVQEFVGKLIKEDRLSARTIGFVASMLKNALSCAVNYEYIINNPYRRITYQRSRIRKS